MVRKGLSVSDPTTIDVDQRDLRAFCRVVDLGSITAAARTLGETKGAVSRRVARLEAQLGTPLLRRAGRGVEATDAGLLYRARAGEGLELLDQAASTLRDLRDVPRGHLRVTAAQGLGSTVLGRVLGPFAERFPEVTVEVLLTDRVLSFGADRIDVALRMSAGLTDSSLVATRLLDLQATLVASPAYVERHGSPATPDDLAAHRLVVVPLRGTSMPITLARGEETTRLSLRGHVCSHDTLLLRDVVIAGAGIGMLPEPVASRDIADGRLVRVLPDWRVEAMAKMWLVHAPGPVPPKARAFCDTVLEVVRRELAGCGG